MLLTEQQYTVKEIATLLEVNPETVRRWIRTNKIQSIKPLGRGRAKQAVVSRKQLEFFLEQNKQIKTDMPINDGNQTHYIVYESLPLLRSILNLTQDDVSAILDVSRVHYVHVEGQLTTLRKPQVLVLYMWFSKRLQTLLLSEQTKRLANDLFYFTFEMEAGHVQAYADKLYGGTFIV